MAGPGAAALGQVRKTVETLMLNPDKLWQSLIPAQGDKVYIYKNVSAFRIPFDSWAFLPFSAAGTLYFQLNDSKLSNLRKLSLRS